MEFHFQSGELKKLVKSQRIYFFPKQLKVNWLLKIFLYMSPAKIKGTFLEKI